MTALLFAYDLKGKLNNSEAKCLDTVETKLAIHWFYIIKTKLLYC